MILPMTLLVICKPELVTMLPNHSRIGVSESTWIFVEEYINVSTIGPLVRNLKSLKLSPQIELEP